LAIAAPRLATTQTKPEAKPSPQPASTQELLRVEPAPKQNPLPDASSQKQQKPSTKIEIPKGEVDDKTPVITNTDLITFNVTVTDIYGRFVSGLSKTVFTIFDEKDQQEFSFFSDEDAPLAIGIVFDITGSMSGEKVQRAKEALSHFFDTSLDTDEYFLITLQSGRAFLTLDRTRDSKAVLEKLTFVQTKGNTAFYDAVYLAAERVQRGTHPKRVVLVISVMVRTTTHAIPLTIYARC
jgi:Ca-activated chloride channel family protein